MVKGWCRNPKVAGSSPTAGFFCIFYTFFLQRARASHELGASFCTLFANVGSQVRVPPRDFFFYFFCAQFSDAVFFGLFFVLNFQIRLFFGALEQNNNGSGGSSHTPTISVKVQQQSATFAESANICQSFENSAR